MHVKEQRHLAAKGLSFQGSRIPPCRAQGGQGAAQRKAEEKRREREQAALRLLAAKEGMLEALTAARLELEALRLLLERVGRRERIKAQRTRPTALSQSFCTARPRLAFGGPQC